jgi:hypothetical protein
LTDLDKTYEDINIRQLKLVNGDDIIAYIQDVGPSGVVIEKPYKVLSRHYPDDKVLGYFVEWMQLGADENRVYNITSAHIISHEEVRSEVKESYIKTVLHQQVQSTEPPSIEEDEYFDEYDIPDPSSDTVH